MCLEMSWESAMDYPLCENADYKEYTRNTTFLSIIIINFYAQII